MNITKLDYEMKAFDEENVELLIKKLEFDPNNYFIAMTKPSVFNTAILGNLIELSNRYCIICFSLNELNLIMMANINTKKVTDIIKINRNEINSIKLSDIFISYMLNIKTSDSMFKFQVFKRVRKFTKIKESIKLFKKIYN